MGYPSFPAPSDQEDARPLISIVEEYVRLGYQMAVEESYPEIWTACSAHRIFNSKCRQCVVD